MQHLEKKKKKKKKNTHRQVHTKIQQAYGKNKLR